MPPAPDRARGLAATQTEDDDMDTVATLDNLAAERTRREQQREQIMADMAKLVRRLHSEGASVAELARRAGVTRNTIYAMLDGPSAARRRD